MMCLLCVLSPCEFVSQDDSSTEQDSWKRSEVFRRCGVCARVESPSIVAVEEESLLVVELLILLNVMLEELAPCSLVLNLRHPLLLSIFPMYLSLIHISEPTRQAEISYAVFCLKKKKKLI
eukprot:TRINITY_DN2096_c0_g1_i5.p2 TRINITY_DN2096_c0_g1~~TRINITY_DN2096_c0_g1_i5.p2  ORF type:complete len:121 (+),score=6.14 TRINITY_DN2096_c0_g1_i5:224-586(+)